MRDESDSEIVDPGLIILNKNTFQNKETREMFSREISNTTERMIELGRRTDNLENIVVIVGCGGIGSWAALYFGSLRTTQDIFLIDPDTIEMSNIGRTPYNVFHVNQLKVAALAKMLTEKNPNLNTIPIPKYFNDELVEELRECSDHNMYSNVLVIDCRDNFFNDYDLFKRLFGEYKVRFLRAAYDGSSITIDFLPEQNPVQGEGGYTVVASHIMPASLAAQILVVMALMDCYDVDVINSNLYRIPLTFDSLKLVEYLFMGVMLERLAKNDYKGSKELQEFILNSKELPAEIVEKNIRITQEEMVAEEWEVNEEEEGWAETSNATPF